MRYNELTAEQMAVVLSAMDVSFPPFATAEELLVYFPEPSALVATEHQHTLFRADKLAPSFL